MGLSVGIVGLPNVGKTTVFNALTGSGALAANYPFATVDPNTGIALVPDPRLGTLTDIFKSKKIKFIYYSWRMADKWNIHWRNL